MRWRLARRTNAEALPLTSDDRVTCASSHSQRQRGWIAFCPRATVQQLCWGLMALPQHMHMQMPPYNDHILTITASACADPYVLLDNGTYYMVGWLLWPASAGFVSD